MATLSDLQKQMRDEQCVLLARCSTCEKTRRFAAFQQDTLRQDFDRSGWVIRDVLGADAKRFLCAVCSLRE